MSGFVVLQLPNIAQSEVPGYPSHVTLQLSGQTCSTVEQSLDNQSTSGTLRVPVKKQYYLSVPLRALREALASTTGMSG